jgi:hypothetical protein
VHRLGPEITKAYVGAGGSLTDRGANESDFDPNLGYNQLHANVRISARLADSKIKALQDQYQRGTYGRGQQKLISDEAEAVRKRLAAAGGAGSAAGPGRGGQSGGDQLPPQAIGRLIEGHNTEFSNGQVWRLQNGKPTRIK